MPLVTLLTLLAAAASAAQNVQTIKVGGLERPVELLRDRWGVPHIYAQTQHDLFFAQGYITAKDRLFQLDLWRRVGTGKLSEVLGPGCDSSGPHRAPPALSRRPAGEWSSYAPDAKEIVTAFTDGINAYIRSLKGARPTEFRVAGYDPGLWAPEDVLARIAGLAVTSNLTHEFDNARAIARFGLKAVDRVLFRYPMTPLEIPRGLDLSDIL